MKTFRELISWELEQERKQKSAAPSLSEDEDIGKLGASVLRKIRYLSAAGGTGHKSSAEGLSAA